MTDRVQKPGGQRPYSQAIRRMILYLIPALAVLWKLYLLTLDAFPFHSDEAIVALMARHMTGGEIPFFFYGQAYLGSLDAILVALGFGLFGEKVLVIRMVQTILYAATVVTAMILAHRWRSNWWTTVFTGVLLAFPAVNVTLYTTVSLGGYGEALLLGNLLVLLALRFREDPTRLGPLAAWGLLAGLGWWAFGLSLVYTLPTAVLIGHSLWPNKAGRGRLILAGVATLAIGSLPWFAGLWSEGLTIGIQEVTGSVIAGASSEIWSQALFEHVRNFLVFGPTVILGVRAPWSSEILHPGAAFAIGALWMGAIAVSAVRLMRSRSAGPTATLWLAVIATLVFGFLTTPFGADPTGRYFLPLSIPLMLLGADYLAQVSTSRRWPLGMIGLALIVGYNVAVTDQLARQNPPGLTTQFAEAARVDHSQIGDLISFLERSGETRGYTNYWIAYPLAFLSEEELVFVPRLPYHSDFRFAKRDSRYEPYETEVGASGRVAYITANHPKLDDAIHRSLEALEVAYRVERIGSYTVFYQLSERVDPSQLILPDAGSLESGQP